MDEGISEQGRTFVRWVWGRFTDAGEWPSRRDALLYVEDELHLDYEKLRSEARASEVRFKPEGPDRVVVGMRSMVEIPEGRALLAPLPRLIRRANAHFKLYPSFNDAHDERTSIPYADVLCLWGDDEKRLALAAEILFRNDGAGGINLGGLRTGFSVHVSLDVLRYRGARSLDDVLALWRRGYQPKPTAPEQQHLDVLRALFAFAQEHLIWPNGTLFALKWRKGYLPELLEGLWPNFVQHQFSPFSHDQIQLRLWALTLLDNDGSWRAKVVKLVAATADLWRKYGDQQFALGELAAEAGVALHDAAVLALFLQTEPWARGFYPHDRQPSDWLVGGEEKIRLFRATQTWDQYVENRLSVYGDWFDRFGKSTLSDPATLISLDSVTDGTEGDYSSLGVPNLLGASVPFLGGAPRARVVPGLGGSAESWIGGALSNARIVLRPESDYLPCIDRDFRELRAAVANGMHKSAMLLCGSIAEAVLLDVLERNSAKVASLDRKQRFPEKASLTDLIAWAGDPSLTSGTRPLLSVSATKQATGLADHRDLIHPRREMRDHISIDPENMNLMVALLLVVLRDLSAAFKDGRIDTFAAS